MADGRASGTERQEERVNVTEPDRLEALRQSKLAAELTDDQCRELAGLITVRELKDGEVLVEEGKSDNRLYAIVKGLLCVVKNAGSPEEVTFFTLGTGAFADELSFMDGATHYASLVARGDTCVLGLEREKLESLLPTHPDIVYKVMRAIVKAVHQIQRQLSMHSVELTNYIYKVHGRY
jgi:CRP/FNR family transcriptional regulator, cyclic AMP receptor protein